MKFIIKHEIKGRIRVHMAQEKMSIVQADTLCYYLERIEGVRKVKVYERTADASVEYTGDRKLLIEKLRHFTYENTKVPEDVLENSGRALNAEYQEKLVLKVVKRAVTRVLLPVRLRNVITAVRSVRYIAEGIRYLLKGKLEVPVLDATAIGVSVIRKDYDTAGSVMFLLGIGEILEEWTHKKSVGDLARSMSLNISKVWLKTEEQEVLVDADKIKPGDQVIVHMGNQIPFDGIVASGVAMVNQASLTGEPLPVQKDNGKYVYAGTVVEEGELIIQVKAQIGATRYERIVTMIEESEKLKSAVEGRAIHLADRLVPYTFLGTGLVWLATRDVTKALSVLMVDFSCALKLAMPVTVLSAMREASDHRITVKGGKYLEALAEAKTIVFDKTGTLTKAQPVLKQVIPFHEEDEDEMLRIAACLEEHFPHSMAKAVVVAARERNLVHEEMHSKVDYIVAHGIASHLGEKQVVLGSYHFVFEDEGCVMAPEEREQFDALPEEYSHLYLAIDKKLSAVLCIEDPLRAEAKDTIASLKKAGFEKVVMMTGDSERTARAVAAGVGVDAYYSEVLPEDKAEFVRKEKEAGRKVVMIGDGINDSPALSAADVGIAISDGAEIAREIADITVAAEDLNELVKLKLLANGMLKRINRNYRLIVGINGSLIALGVAGVLAPATSALLHNTSTLLIGIESMRDLL